jgi:hypothetical protein
MNATTSSILRGSALGVAASVALNAVIFFAGKAAGFFPETVIIGGNGPLSIVPVLISSSMPLLIAAGVFWALARWTKSPKKIFTAIALTLLLVSFASPFSIPEVPAGMIVGLNLMHIVAALSITIALTTNYKPSEAQ